MTKLVPFLCHMIQFLMLWVNIRSTNEALSYSFSVSLKQCMPIIIFSCTRSLYLVQCSHLEHFYRFFKSGIPEKPYIIRVSSVVPIISLTPIKYICCISYLFNISTFTILPTIHLQCGQCWRYSLQFYAAVSYQSDMVSHTAFLLSVSMLLLLIYPV